jgi:hypothetical protein
MSIRYKLVENPFTNENDIVNKIDGNKIISIPMVEANTDYQEYLEWLSDGNTPEEAE